MSQKDSFTQQHNQQQRDYFEATVKKTMLPVDSPYIRRQVEEMLKFGDIGLQAKVLEVGCGMGRYTLDLARRGIQIEGMDFSQILLDRLCAFNVGHYNIHLHCADILSPPAGLENRFDAVIGFFTLHHLHDLPGCFTAMARLLRRGGRMVFVEPNPLNPLYYLQILFTPGIKWRRERGLLRMRPNTIFHSMEIAGLHSPATTRFGFFPPFLSNRTWGRGLESILERVLIWRPILPFQLFKAQRE